MSEHSKMLMRLFWAVFCLNTMLFALWICALFWFDVGVGMIYAFTALLVVGVVGGRVLRIAFTKSLRRDRALIDAPGEVGL